MKDCLEEAIKICNCLIFNLQPNLNNVCGLTWKKLRIQSNLRLHDSVEIGTKIPITHFIKGLPLRIPSPVKHSPKNA